MTKEQFKEALYRYVSMIKYGTIINPVKEVLDNETIYISDVMDFTESIDILYSNKHKKFDYKVEVVMPKYLFEILMSNGKDGWELCSYDNNTAIFKREIL